MSESSDTQSLLEWYEQEFPWSNSIRSEAVAAWNHQQAIIDEWKDGLAHWQRDAEKKQVIINEMGAEIAEDAKEIAARTKQLMEAGNRIAELEAEREWIPVSERLPGDGQNVVARYEGVYEHRAVTFWMSHGEPRFGQPSQPATHWHALSPLPTPPQQE